MGLKELIREGRAQGRAADAVWKNSGIKSGTRASVFKAGFAEGVVYECERHPGWISVKKRLPNKRTRYAGKHGVQVLYYDEKEDPDGDRRYMHPSTASFMFKEKKFLQLHISARGSNQKNEWLGIPVTHWMPMPARPEKRT